jgi:hypothetical protein
LRLSARAASVTLNLQRHPAQSDISPNGHGLREESDAKTWDKKVCVMAEDRKDHVLDTAIVDALDTDDGGEDTCALIWCHTHQRFEWHYVNRARIGTTGEILRRAGTGALR